MKVLLMQPLNEFVAEPPNIPDLGLGYIATALKKRGHIIHVMDWNKKTTAKDFKAWLKENRPEVVGIKVFTKDVGAAQKTISLAREVMPDTVIVIGGPHPSAVDHDGELMEDFACCDFAIRGEAELSFPSLLHEISHNMENSTNGSIVQESALKIPGLVWRGKERVYSNPIVLLHDLDTLEFPAWELLDPKDYDISMFGSTQKEGNTVPIITTRGCPGKCSFCSAFNVNGRKIRARSPENVLKEILFLHETYNARKFMFQDNCFTSVKENLVKLCQLIIKEKLQIEWDCVSYERLSNLTDETLSVMYKAGCRMIHMGIESGSPKTRKVMNKSGSLDEIAEKVSIVQGNGIKVCAWFMLGFPGETKEDMKTTIRYSFSLFADMVTFTACFPLPGSQVYRYLKELYGFDRIDWANFDISRSPYPVSRLTSQKLTRLLKFVRFRLRLKRAASGITKFLKMSGGK